MHHYAAQNPGFFTSRQPHFHVEGQRNPLLPAPHQYATTTTGPASRSARRTSFVPRTKIQSSSTKRAHGGWEDKAVFFFSHRRGTICCARATLLWQDRRRQEQSAAWCLFRKRRKTLLPSPRFPQSLGCRRSRTQWPRRLRPG